LESPSPFVIPLRELPAERTVALDNAFVRESVKGLPMRAALERPEDDTSAGQAEAVLSLYGEADNVFARGTVKGWLEVACSRCVGVVRVDIDETVGVSFLPKERVPEDDSEETEVHEDDLDLFPYEGDQIDLERLLREQVVLSVPFAPLCNESCAGLCAVCGADKNLEPCDCQPPPDPRLAALKDFKV